MRTLVGHRTVLLLILLLAGCGGHEPVPADRLHFPAGAFSYVTPDGWCRTKLTGVPFLIVWTEADLGARPNIYIDGVEPGSNLDVAATNTITNSRGNIVCQQVEFVTTSGMTGLKITAARKNKDGLPLAIFHYLIADKDRIIATTCICAQAAAAKYEPVFDQAMKSVQTEGREERTSNTQRSTSKAPKPDT